MRQYGRTRQLLQNMWRDILGERYIGASDLKRIAILERKIKGKVRRQWTKKMFIIRMIGNRVLPTSIKIHQTKIIFHPRTSLNEFL